MNDETHNVNIDKLAELNAFNNELFRYRVILNLLHEGRSLSKVENHEGWELVKILWKKTGYLSKLIMELAGLKSNDGSVPYFDMWTTAFKIPVDELSFNAIGDCIQYTNIAIGQLEKDITAGIRDKNTGEIISPLSESKFEVPKAFISHGKESDALKRLEDFLEDLGVIPLIVKEQPSLDKTVDDKVEYYLNQADFVIILATGDDQFDNKLHPRQNVIHEIGLAQTTHAGKIIYLLEEETEFPSNISPKVWERFKQRDMLNAFQCIIRELRALGMLFVTKSSKV
jgi:predicted nucleotide-binding protein